MQKLIGALILGLVIVAAPVYASSHTDEEQINTVLQAFVEAYNKGDATAAGNLYSPDANIFPPGSNAVSGRNAITQLYQAIFDENADDNAEAIALDIDVHDDVAIMIGRFKIVDSAGRTNLEGNFLMVFGHSEAGWLIDLEMWTEIDWQLLGDPA